MKILLLLFSLLPLTAYSQIQIGNDLLGEFENDLFGSSVALSKDGKILVVGSITNSDSGVGAGQVQVFENVNDAWVQIGKDINGDGPDAKLGRGIAVSDDGTIIALGADGNDSRTGNVRVFENSDGSWTQIGQELVGINTGSLFGNEVSLSSDGRIVAVGAPGNLQSQGSVQVFQYQGDTWTQLGVDINGEVNLGLFGNGLDLSADGQTVAIGGDGLLAGEGTLRILQYLEGTWTQIGQAINGEVSFDRLGSNVSISDDGAIVAASALGNEANGISTGAVRVYRNVGGNWEKIGNDLIGDNLNDQFGASVSLSYDGQIVAVGSLGAEHERIFKNIDDNWVERANIQGEEGSFFGLQSHLSKDGLTVAVGAQSFDGSGSDRGLVRVFRLQDILSAVDNVQEKNIELFPNPTSGFVTVRMDNNVKLERMMVYNNLGQMLLTSNNEFMDLSGLHKGLYHLVIVSNKGRFLRTVVVD